MSNNDLESCDNYYYLEYLTLYHGRQIFDPSPLIIREQIISLAALDLHYTHVIDHYFECEIAGESDGSVADLVWEKQNDYNRFTSVIIGSHSLHMDLTGVSFHDLGVYFCRNEVTGEQAFVDMQGGMRLPQDKIV